MCRPTREHWNLGRAGFIQPSHMGAKEGYFSSVGNLTNAVKKTKNLRKTKKNQKTFKTKNYPKNPKTFKFSKKPGIWKKWIL